MDKKLGCCNGKNLSSGGTSLLNNTSLVIYLYRITVGMRETFESIEANFLWSEDKNKNK
jgi:hypothetical protein